MHPGGLRAPAGAGEFQVFNQITEAMSVADIAKTVSASFRGIAEIEYLDNPRVELDEHYYNVIHTGLVGLGLAPHLLSDTLIDSLFGIVEHHIDRADLSAMRPHSQLALHDQPTALTPAPLPLALRALPRHGDISGLSRPS